MLGSLDYQTRTIAMTSFTASAHPSPAVRITSTPLRSALNHRSGRVWVALKGDNEVARVDFDPDLQPSG